MNRVFNLFGRSLKNVARTTSKTAKRPVTKKICKNIGREIAIEAAKRVIGAAISEDDKKVKEAT